MFFRAVPRVATRSASAAASKRLYHLTSSTSPSNCSPISSFYACQQSKTFTKRPVLLKQQVRSVSEHAIANPELAGIEKRWDGMTPQEQADLWMKLRDRMKVDWNDLTWQEKKAAYWISFGPHGPRAETPKGEGFRVFFQVTKYILISVALFALIRSFAGPAPKSMTKEWQEATNEYLKAERMDPLTGVSSEGYSGKGHVQSPPAKQ